VLRFRHTKDMLADLEPTTTRHALQRLRANVAAHDTGNRVLFDARAWIVTAVKGPSGAARA
jgi:hypothetical protein